LGLALDCCCPRRYGNRDRPQKRAELVRVVERRHLLRSPHRRASSLPPSTYTNRSCAATRALSSASAAWPLALDAPLSIIDLTRRSDQSFVSGDEMKTLFSSATRPRRYRSADRSRCCDSGWGADGGAWIVWAMPRSQRGGCSARRWWHLQESQ